MKRMDFQRFRNFADKQGLYLIIETDDEIMFNNCLYQGSTRSVRVHVQKEVVEVFIIDDLSNTILKSQLFFSEIEFFKTYAFHYDFMLELHSPAIEWRKHERCSGVYQLFGGGECRYEKKSKIAYALGSVEEIELEKVNFDRFLYFL